MKRSRQPSESPSKESICKKISDISLRLKQDLQQVYQLLQYVCKRFVDAIPVDVELETFVRQLDEMTNYQMTDNDSIKFPSYMNLVQIFRKVDITSFKINPSNASNAKFWFLEVEDIALLADVPSSSSLCLNLTVVVNVLLHHIRYHDFFLLARQSSFLKYLAPGFKVRVVDERMMTNIDFKKFYDRA